jgi:2-polyprenyl-3-methyl-5-hydroxy-6-metoxy-1,4-benzoquinol methylase
MRNEIKNYIGHLIYKTMGTTEFTRRIEWRSMLEWLNPKEGERILDVACEGGTLSLKTVEKGCVVYGIDLSEDAVKYAKRLAEIDRTKFEPDINIWMNMNREIEICPITYIRNMSNILLL